MIQSVQGLQGIQSPFNGFGPDSGLSSVENQRTIPTKCSVGESALNPNLKQFDEVTQSKVNQSILDYERMVEVQLQDQQLYYEKLIARETVRAMEYSFRDQSASGASNKGKKIAAADLNFNDGMHEIESMKCEITILESEYKLLQEQLKKIDEDNKKYKNLSDDASKQHKSLVSYIRIFVTN
jgi:hypothetical protein